MRHSLLLGVVAACVAIVPARAEPSIVFDAQSGRVIASEDAFARWYPASLTKLMTTYVAFRMVKSGEVTMASPIRMSKEAAKEPPSKMGFKPGTVLTLDNALKIIMVKSANDVAAAIGDSLGGSKAGWAARMNAESARLGMTGSHWVNANGWHDDDQYTTPRDLGILASALRNEFPQYASYFSLEGFTFGKSRIANHNTLIGRFAGADGMKTGYTCPAGYNLVGSATRNGRTLMAVVLGSTSVKLRAEKAAGMLAKGFEADTVGAPTLDELKPSGAGIGQATNMRDRLCSKAARAELRKQWLAEQKAKKEKAKAAKAEAAKAEAAKGDEPEDEEDAAVEASSYLTAFDHPRVMVPVVLGGATGPVPKAMALQIAAEAAEEAAAQAAEAAAEAARPFAPGIPLPTWRPDQPSPEGAEPMIVQGDAASVAQ